MRTITICFNVLLLVLLLTANISAESVKEQKPTRKSEIMECEKILEMDYKSDEIQQIINDTIPNRPDLVNSLLRGVVFTFEDRHPVYRNIGIEDLKYDLNNYYITPGLTVKQLIEAEPEESKMYLPRIVIPVYLDDLNVFSFVIYYDGNRYDIIGHSSYPVYDPHDENISILDLSLPKEKFEELAKSEIGEDVIIYNQYLILGTPDFGYRGMQEDNIYIETNKGEYIFVSISGPFVLSEIADIKNNSFYSVEDYFSSIKPALNAKRPSWKVEYNSDGSIKKSDLDGGAVGSDSTPEHIENKKIIGIPTIYITIISATVLLIGGGIWIIVSQKGKKEKHNQ